MAATDEDTLFRIAINESLQPPSTTSVPGQMSPSNQASKDGPSTPPRINIDDMIDRLATRNTAELPGFDDPQGDTWVFIDAAPQQPEQDRMDYEHYVKRCATPIQLKKETLMRLNSPSINSAFGPTAQHRLLRRRQLVNKLPQGIRYVIDLTPPNEGDDAVWLISSLSCSEGVRLWYQSQEIWAVSATLAGGDEEYTSVRSNAIRSPRTQPNSLKHPSSLSNGQDSISSSPPSCRTRKLPIVPEYSPIRHRAAIERLLAAAAGADPKLDSAPKLWTTFAVARHLEITHSPLTDFIVTWLRAYPNSVFLEVLTETGHIMADHLEVYDLARDTFAILVGEEALDSKFRSRSPEANHSLSAFGRKKEDLPEHIQTRVEYASKKFTERVIADFDELKSARWIESLPEYQMLSSFTAPELQDTVSTLKAQLQRFVQGAILHIQWSQYEVVPGADLPLYVGEDLVPRVVRKKVYNSLSAEERLLTRTFWNALDTLNLFDGITNLHISEGWEKTAALCVRFSEPDLANDGYERVRKIKLKAIVTHGRDILKKMNQPSGQTTENAIEGRSTSAVYVPMEVAKRFPKALPLRSKPSVGSEPSVPAFTLDPVMQHGVAEWQDTASHCGWRSPGGLDRLIANVKSSNTSDAPSFWDTLPWLPADEEDSNPPTSRGKEHARSETETENEETVDDWAEVEKMSHHAFTDEIFETTPLLSGTNGAPYRFTGETFDPTPSRSKVNELLGTTTEHEARSNEKQGTKRRADTPEPQSSTSASTSANIAALQISPKKAKRPASPKEPEFFNLENFFIEAENHVRFVARQKLAYTDALNGRKEPYELNIINTLVCLDDPEFKYLPLWAGGCDDGSGGVFNDDIAIPDVSFATAGPNIKHGSALHTVSECDTISDNGVVRGIATPTSSVPSSEYHIVNYAASTLALSSNHTTAGYFSDKLDPNEVYAADSIDGSSVAGDTVSVVARSEGMNPDDEEEQARRQIDAMELIEAAERHAAEEKLRQMHASAEDENYADLFGSDDGDNEDEGDASDDTEMGQDDDCGSPGELI